MNSKKLGGCCVDYFIILIFIIAIIYPIIIASNQKYNIQYGDDIEFVYWAKTHHTNSLNIFEKLGTGYRPMMLVWLWISYNLWGADTFYYYLLNGILFAIAMIFLYLFGKLLHSKKAGIIAVFLYLFLDGTFIMVSKFSFIAFSSEILFIISALYFLIHYYKTNNKKSMLLGIILSVFAFLSKEPSLLIIPIVNLTYLSYSKQLNKNHILLCSIPFLYMLIIMFWIAPDVGINTSTNTLQRVITNLIFYIEDELFYQFKIPILLLAVSLITVFYYYTNRLKKEIALCIVWFIVALVPFLITGQKVQHTYLIETNIGIVLLIGIVVLEGLKENSIISGLLLISIILQLIVVPIQIIGMQKYNDMNSDNQKTFFETVDFLHHIPSNSTVFYFSEKVRVMDGTQINEDFLKKYLYIQNLCDIKVTTNYSDAKYIILPSSLDINIFQKKHQINDFIILKTVINGNDKGIVLKKK